jgi:hypothetical protein
MFVTVAGDEDGNTDFDRVYVASTRPIPGTEIVYPTFGGLDGSRWGESVDIDGDTVVLGAPGNARVVSYDLNAAEYSKWTATVGGMTDNPLRPLQTFDGTSHQGEQVVIDVDGTWMYTIGDSGSTLQPYTRAPGNPWTAGSPRLNPSGGTAFTGGAEVLDLSNNRLLVGSPGEQASFSSTPIRARTRA